jgi:hypothetical protein
MCSGADAVRRGDSGAAQKVTVQHVAGAYSSVFTMQKHTGLIVDPPDGRLPTTAGGEATRGDSGEFELALLQPTEIRKNKMPECAGGQYGRVSPKRNEPGTWFAVGFRNRTDGPEDLALGERCLGFVLPDFGRGLAVLSANRLIAGRRVHLLRCRTGARVATRRPHYQPTASAESCASLVGRLPRALGGRHVGRRRNHLRLQARLQGIS